MKVENKTHKLTEWSNKELQRSETEKKVGTDT